MRDAKPLFQAPTRPPKGETCPLCSVIHDEGLCNDHKGSTGLQCGRRRPPDAEICYMHSVGHGPARAGGVDAKLARENAKIAKLAGAVPMMLPKPYLTAVPDLHNRGALPVDNPVVELSRMAGILRDAFEQAGARVNALASISVETRAGGEQLRGEVVLWEKLIGHLRVTLVDMAKLGLEERLVRLEEKRAELVAEALFWLVGAAVQQLELNRPQRLQLESLMQQAVERIVTTVDMPEPVQYVVSSER